MTTIFRRAMLIAACLPAAAGAQAPTQDIAALESRLLIALDAAIGAPGGPAAPIDRRLRLIRCPESVAIDPPALGAVALRCASLGWRIRVPLLRDARATAMVAQVKAMPLVKRGDPVEIVAQAPGFSVSAQGIAQEDGVQGARIRVKTDPKSPVMFAQVVDLGLVRVSTFK